MATYVMQGLGVPTGGPLLMAAIDVVTYSLTSAADGTALTGTGNMLGIVSEEAGWLHVSTTDSDKAAASKTHRVQADTRLEIGGVVKGQYISFLADAA